MPQVPNLADMLKAGVHFGHQRSRWHPKMQPYIFGVRNGVHVIDLDKTQEELSKALTYIKDLAAHGKVILFVGTKRQARDFIKTAAERSQMPYIVERWVGGLLTNFDEFRRRLKKYKGLKDMVATGEIEKYTKKEQVKLRKQLSIMDKYLAGLQNLERLPDALYIADMRVEKTAVTEAERMHVPVVAVCDTNVNPTKVAYAIPANDDAVHAVKMMADLMAEAVMEGAAEFEKNKTLVKEAAVKATDGKQSEEKSGVYVMATRQAVADETAGKKERRALRTEEVV